MGFFDFFQWERWDPDSVGADNIIYTTIPSTKISGNFYKYTPTPRNTLYYKPDEDRSVYWDKDLGDLYYNIGNGYQKLDASAFGLNLSPGYGSFASDDLLDAAWGVIENLKILDALQRESGDETTADGVVVTSNQDQNQGGLGDIKIDSGESSSSSSKVDDEYRLALLDADNVLLNLIAESDALDSRNGSNSTKKTTYYKYGENEIDLKYYLHNLGTNLLNYLNSQDWSTAQKDAFRKAYENYKSGLTAQLNDGSNRFSTDDSGYLVDSLGLMSGQNDHIYIDENGNTYNSLDEITDKKLRKTAIEFSPNDEVANYFNAVGQSIVDAGKVKGSETDSDSGAFDLNKNGFMSYWVNKVNPAGGKTDLNPYFALDPVNSDGKRGRTNRAKYLIHELNSYARKIESSNYNFENSAFGSKEEFLTKVRQAINNLSNGWDSSDAASLQAIGITPEFYDEFMTDKPTIETTTEEEAAAAEKKKENEASLFIGKAKERYDAYANTNNHFTKTDNTTRGYRVSKVASLDASKEGWEKLAAYYLNKLGYSIDASNQNVEQIIGQLVSSLWDKTLKAFRAGSTQVSTSKGMKNLSDILPILISISTTQTGDTQIWQPSEDGSLIYNDIDNDFINGAILTYKDNKLYYDWIGNHRECAAWLKLEENFEKLYAESSDKSSDKPKYSFHKLGGSIQKFAPGGELDLSQMTPEQIEAYQEYLSQTTDATTSEDTAETTTEETPTEVKYANGNAGEILGNMFTSALFDKNKEAAAAKGMSYTLYVQKLRKPNGAPDVYNSDNGIWKPEDMIRLGAIAADIVSLVLDPVSGGIANVGSTAANFVADWLDGSVTTGEMWKNLGTSLGMDVLSLVPIVGDAAGTGGKLLKSVKKFAPKIMYALTAYGALATVKNLPNITESLKKVTSDEKLTVGDWLNIAQAITAIAGVNNGVKSAVAKRLAKSKAKTDNAIGLGLRKKEANGEVGKAQDFIFRGKHATELKKLVNEGDKGKIDDYLKNLDGFSDYEVNTHLKANPIETQLPVGKKLGDDGKSHWGLRSPFNVARKIDAFEIYDKSKLREGYASKTHLNTNRLDAVDTANIFDENSLFTHTEIDALEKLQLDALRADALKSTERRKKTIAEQEKRLYGTRDENGNVIEEGLESKVAKAKADLQTTTTERQAIELAITEISNKGHDKTTRIIGRSTFELSKPDKIRTKKADLRKDSKRIDDLLDVANERIKNIKAKMASVGLTTKSYKKYESELNEAIADRSNLESLKRQVDDLYNDLDTWASDYEKLTVTKQTNNTKQVSLLELLRTLQGAEQTLTNAIASYSPELAALKRILDTSNPNGIRNATSHAKQRLLDQIQNGFTITYGNGKTREVKDVALKLALDTLMKRGGRLQFLAEGDKINGVLLKQDAGTWKLDIFDKYRAIILLKLLEDPDYYLKLNNMLTSHYNIYSAANNSGDWKNNAYVGSDNSVGNYQQRYDDMGYNTSGIGLAYDTRYVFKPSTKRTSKDNPRAAKNGKWVYDNLYSQITDDRRILGRLGDWSAEELKAFNDELKGMNYEMYLDPTNNYYYIKKLDAPITPGGHDLNTIALNTSQTGGHNDPLSKSKKSNPFKLGNIRPELLDYLRYKIADNGNKRLAQYAMSLLKPYLQTPLQDYVYITSDLAAEARGRNLKADLLSIAMQNLTADATKNQAFLRESAKQGDSAVTSGYETSNKMLQATRELDREYRKENHKQEHLVGESNRLAALQSAADRATIWKSYLSQHNTDRDNLLKGFITRYETDLLKKKAQAESALQAQVQAAVQNNPKKYGANLSSAELSIYNQGRSGVKNSGNMSDTELANYTSAVTKINNALVREYYKALGIPESPYAQDAYADRKTGNAAVITLSDPDKSSAIHAKDGTKLESIRAKVRQKNADRVTKSIEKSIDRLNKKLDQISKSMYGLPKLKLVK